MRPDAGRGRLSGTDPERDLQAHRTLPRDDQHPAHAPRAQGLHKEQTARLEAARVPPDDEGHAREEPQIVRLYLPHHPPLLADHRSRAERHALRERGRRAPGHRRRLARDGQGRAGSRRRPGPARPDRGVRRNFHEARLAAGYGLRFHE